MKPKIQSVKGARDFYPEQMALRNWLYENMKAAAQQFGYQEYDGPFLETLDLYAAKSGEELVKEQSFVFNDRGGDQVALIDTIEDTSGPDPQLELSQTEMREALGEAIARLPEREKLVITLYYYEELTLREIGDVLGVTESRVSQLHTKAILRLKSRLGGGSPLREPLEK